MLAPGNLTLEGMARDLPAELRFVLPGQPITKKNSQEIVLIPVRRKLEEPVAERDCCSKCRRPLFGRDDSKRPIIVPSAAYKAWSTGLGYIANRIHVDHDTPLEGLVTVKALFYCQHRGHGDLNNYTAALADWLEACQILKNDKLIASWDGSRVLIDKYKPRVEVTISAFLE